MKPEAPVGPQSTTPAAAESPKRPWITRTTIAIAVTAVLVVAGGVFWWSRSPAAHAEPEVGAAAPVTSRGLLKFDPFVVNLSDGIGSRFLRTSLQLIVEPADAATAAGANPVLMLQLRSALLELLAQQTADVLVTPAGKSSVKAAIVSRAQVLIGDGKITDVLFSEFVVQF